MLLLTVSVRSVVAGLTECRQILEGMGFRAPLVVDSQVGCVPTLGAFEPISQFDAHSPFRHI
jgi:hypothetical protein